MKTETRDDSRERTVLIAMVTDRSVLARLSAKWDDKGMFASPWANLVATWCVEHFRKFDAAPGRSVQTLFAAWADSAPDKDTRALVERFLEGLSDEDDRTPPPAASVVLDMAGEYFNRILLIRHTDAVRGEVDHGRVPQALARAAGFKAVAVGGPSSVDVLQDKEAIRAAFESHTEAVVKYPGDAGLFFGDSLERDGFVAFMGPEKSGKTWHLIDLAWRAMQQRRRVLFFEVGDLSQDQVMRRFMVRAARHPLKAKTVRYPSAIRPAGDAPEVELVDKVFAEDLTYTKAYKACLRVMRQEVKSEASLFKLSVHPNDSISAAGVHAAVADWRRDGFVADVVIIDYADILAPPPGLEGRDRIDQTWKTLRRVSQECHCLVVTATQTKVRPTGSGGAKVLTREDFADDKRKLAHVTGMVGINVADEERPRGLRRLNWVARREEAYESAKVVHLASCLDFGNVCVRSTF